MTTAYTSLLGLALPVTGELSGTWGDTVNNSITSLLDSAVAGTTTITADTTLSTTTGAANQARQAILLCSPVSANITITAPAQSKIYTVINTSATYTVTVRGVGPTTGVTLAVSETAVIAWNGSDFVRISSSTTFTAPVVIEGTTTSAALRITQLGTGNALLVEDSSNPDSTPFVIDSSGNVIIGNTTAISSYSSVVPSVSQHGLTVSQATNSITHWGNSSTGTPQFLLSKSRGGAIGTRAIVSSNDTLGNFSVWGDDGTTFVEATRISAQVDGTPGTNDMPGRLVFSTTADGASTPTERMRIDSAGRIGIGATPAAGYNILSSKNITGATSAIGIASHGQIQSDVTSTASMFRTSPTVAAASFTLTNLDHFVANQGAIGAGATVTAQVGFNVSANLTGATNNYGFYGNLASAANTYNLYMAGTASNYLGGNTIISVTDNTNAALRVTQLGTGNALLVEDSTNPDATPFVISNNGSVIVGKDSALTNYKVDISTTGEPFSTAKFVNSNSASLHLFAKSRSTTPGTYSILSNGDGIASLNFAGDDGTAFITAASISAAVDGTPGTSDMPGRLVFSTTADGASTPTERMRIDNAGNVGIGTTAITARRVAIGGNMTGSTFAYGLLNAPTVQPDVTANAYITFAQGITAANGGTPYTITNLIGYAATQGTFNADSTVTNQYGFFVANTLTGATNNYGFYSSIASGTGRWNLYMAGTASNYLGGNTIISVTDNTNAALRITQLGTGNALLVEDSTNPDSTPFVIDSAGRLLTGITSAPGSIFGGGYNPQIQVWGVGPATSSQSFASFNTAGAGNGSRMWLARSRGSFTAGVPTYGLVSNNDTLGDIQFAGDDGTVSGSFVTAAQILAQVDGTPGTNDMPGRLIFSTTADGASSPTERMRIDSSGNVLVTSAAGLGYGTGAGGTVTQATSKSTAVTLNKPTGQITMNNAALAANTTVTFTLTNSLLTTTDNIVFNLVSGTGTPSSYQVWAQMYSGAAFVNVRNISAGSLSEGIIIQYSIIKGATS